MCWWVVGCCDHQAPDQYQGHFAWWSHNHQANLVKEMLQLWFSKSQMVEYGGRSGKLWDLTTHLQVDLKNSKDPEKLVLGASTSHQNSGPNIIQASHMIGANLMPIQKSEFNEVSWVPTVRCSTHANSEFSSVNSRPDRCHSCGTGVVVLIRSFRMWNCAFSACVTLPQTMMSEWCKQNQEQSRTWNEKNSNLRGTWMRLIYHPWSCSFCLMIMSPSQTFLIHNFLGVWGNKRKSTVRLLWNPTLPIPSPNSMI